LHQKPSVEKKWSWDSTHWSKPKCATQVVAMNADPQEWNHHWIPLNSFWCLMRILWFKKWWRTLMNKTYFYITLLVNCPC
jgi:hypothetical protein